MQLFTLFSMQRFSALFPGVVVKPLLLKIPIEFRRLYADSTLTPDDVLTFGYQIASGMVSTAIVLDLSLPQQLLCTIILIASL